MELLTIQHLQDAKPTHIISACAATDTCPSCGAGYKVGLSACEYCRTPVVRHWSVGAAEVAPVNEFAILQKGEFIIPARPCETMRRLDRKFYEITGQVR